MKGKGGSISLKGGIDSRGRKAKAASSNSSVLRPTLNRETGVNQLIPFLSKKKGLKRRA